ncbi:MAG: hypothetical protein ACYSWP_25800, partial [Planctomycetota bacterium]
MYIPRQKLIILPITIAFLLAPNIGCAGQARAKIDKHTAKTLNAISKETKLDLKNISILAASKKYLANQKKEIRLFKILNTKT